MWLEIATELGLTPAAPASESALRTAEAAVGCPLPDPLRALLLETNGLEGEDGLELVLSAEQIHEHNTTMRGTPDFAELYMPFDPLLFFGTEGNGDLFGFRILAGEADDMTVFVWDHETDSRTATSAGLERFLRGERWHEPDEG